MMTDTLTTDTLTTDTLTTDTPATDTMTTDSMTTDVAAADTLRLGTVFTKAFAIYGRRFLPFFLLTVVASIPYYIGLVYLAVVVLPITLASDTDPGKAALAGLGAAAVGLLKVVTSLLASGMVTYGVLQDLRGRRFSVVESFRVVLGRLLPLLGIVTCVVFGIALGLLLLAVPGIMLACRWYLSVPVCIAERTGVFDSMGRSRDLTAGHRWQIFGAGALVIIAGWIFGAAASLAAAPFSVFAVQVAALALSAVVTSFTGVLVGAFYYELRVAKEGVDIERIASVFD
jgi:hypothetical protein